MNCLILGFGNIARAFCAIDYLPIRKIFIIDKINYQKLIEKFFKNSYNYEFYNIKITQDNLHFIKNLLLKNNIDIILDCSYNIDCLDLLKSLPPKVSYLNTSVEYWENEDTTSKLTSLKQRQEDIKKWYNKTKPKNTIILDCGMNPGLISAWAFDCTRIFKINPQDVEKCLISEFDSQIPKIKPKSKKIFMNTWSPSGYLEECHSPIEGHSSGKYYINKDTSGYSQMSISLRPGLTPFKGFSVRHSESITIHKLFPKATISFIYSSCPESIKALNGEYNEMKPITKEKIIHHDEIKDGRDELGVWISANNNLYWYGSFLGNKDLDNYKNKKYLNATSVQVAGGLLLGFRCLIECKMNNIYRLMWPENIIEFEKFDDWLQESNKNLNIKVFKYKDNKKIVKEFINMKTFQDHFI